MSKSKSPEGWNVEIERGVFLVGFDVIPQITLIDQGCYFEEDRNPDILTTVPILWMHGDIMTCGCSLDEFVYRANIDISKQKCDQLFKDWLRT